MPKPYDFTDNEQYLEVFPTLDSLLPTVPATKCNTMFVAVENLPNSFFPCGYVSVIFRIYLHTLQPIPTFLSSVATLFASLCMWGAAASYYQLAEFSVSISFGTCVLRKNLFFDLKLLKAKLAKASGQAREAEKVQYFISTT